MSLKASPNTKAEALALLSRLVAEGREFPDASHTVRTTYQLSDRAMREVIEAYDAQPARTALTMLDQHAATACRETLSDGSAANNVHVRTIEGRLLVFGCLTADHARALAEMINECAWIEAD